MAAGAGHQYMSHLGDAASSHGECVVCLERQALRLAVLCAPSGQRVCRHFVCWDCATQLPEPMLCPICRAHAARAALLPAPHRDPRTLFALVNTSASRYLSRRDLLDYCVAASGLPARAVREEVHRHWSSWDDDGDGAISYTEFAREVCPMLERFYLREVKALRRQSEPPPVPRDTEAARRWFDFFDEDGSGTLERGEVLRALRKTFRGMGSEELGQILAAICPTDELDFQSFRSGLYEYLQAYLPAALPGARSPRSGEAAAEAEAGASARHGRGPPPPGAGRSAEAAAYGAEHVAADDSAPPLTSPLPPTAHAAAAADMPAFARAQEALGAHKRSFEQLVDNINHGLYEGVREVLAVDAGVLSRKRAQLAQLQRRVDKHRDALRRLDDERDRIDLSELDSHPELREPLRQRRRVFCDVAGVLAERLERDKVLVEGVDELLRRAAEPVDLGGLMRRVQTDR